MNFRRFNAAKFSMNLESLKPYQPIFKHLAISIGSVLIVVLIFFYVYLPFTTNHGETISVPDIRNQHVNELENILVSRSLRYEVNTDSGYSSDQEPLTVLDQYPAANSKVKENRKIYVTLNARKPPMVKMPDLKDKSLMIAQITLQSFGLKLGRTTYQPDLALNAVLEQYIKGRPVPAGEMIPKGSSIDLDLGNGSGKQQWEMFDYVNQRFEDARFSIISIGLSLRRVTYVRDATVTLKSTNALGDTILTTITVPKGNIVRQLPAPGQTVRLQDIVDLWIYQPDSVGRNTSILDSNN